MRSPAVMLGLRYRVETANEVMVSQLSTPAQSEVIYPDTDGKPMANNTKQFRWILVIQQNIDWLYADNPNVFVAGDLFWYPIQGKNTIVNAPDVMVVFGRPKGDRGSYKQWEEDDIAPQVVFEILSPGNTQEEMDKKLLFYDRYGVEETISTILIIISCGAGCEGSRVWM